MAELAFVTADAHGTILPNHHRRRLPSYGGRRTIGSVDGGEPRAKVLRG